jgi:hypothetical protein
MLYHCPQRCAIALMGQLLVASWFSSAENVTSDSTLAWLQNRSYSLSFKYEHLDDDGYSSDIVAIDRASNCLWSEKNAFP